MQHERGWTWKTHTRAPWGDMPACQGNCFARSKKAALRKIRQITNQKVMITPERSPK